MGFGGHVLLFDEPCGVANTGPSLGKSDPQLHSEKCTMCALYLTMRFRDVPACDWKTGFLFVEKARKKYCSNEKKINSKRLLSMKQH